ncbi:unnamed protein product [Arabidopsis halleri]
MDNHQKLLSRFFADREEYVGLITLYTCMLHVYMYTYVNRALYMY